MRVLALFFLFVFCLMADTNETNSSNLTTKKIENINEIKAQIQSIDESIKTNIWLINLTNSLNYKRLNLELKDLKKEQNLVRANSEKADELKTKIKTISEQIGLLKEYEISLFASILALPNIDEAERVTNPIKIIAGYSNIKHLEAMKAEYLAKLNSLDVLISKLENKQNLLLNLGSFDENLRELNILKDELNEFRSARAVGITTYGVFEKKIDEQIAAIKKDITAQIKHSANIFFWIIGVILIAFICKYFTKRYIKDNEKLYITNKVINIINILLIMLILLFGYIENIGYLITILGFASAGLAIAMKDMFMSILGYFVIIIGGSLRVGDRIRVKHVNGANYVGDIVDISLLRITIYEDITYTTYLENRRAGRIIFIPNNYIFTELISNYSHNGMKTVWDGIDILLSFDSNHKKAMWIIKEIVRQYSKGYTDIAKKQMMKLRDQYSIRNSNVEPRIYSFFEPSGIQISVWYMTNSFATLALRSTICAEILESFSKEDDIKIAYPTQTLYYEKKHNPNFSDENGSEI